jgi:thiamine-phosphate pyrophosphorylase
MSALPSVHPSLRRGGLYALTDGPRPDLVEVCEHVLQGGAALLQYRDETTDAPRRLSEAQALAALCRRYQVPFIVYGDIALAAAVDAGVHLDFESDVGEARDALGPGAIIGVSCHDSIEHAHTAVAAGADYVSFGAFFPSPTKPNAGRASVATLRQAAALGVALVAIGGITLDNGPSLIDAGAHYLAVVSAVFSADHPEKAAHDLAALFEGHA